MPRNADKPTNWREPQRNQIHSRHVLRENDLKMQKFNFSVLSISIGMIFLSACSSGCYQAELESPAVIYKKRVEQNPNKLRPSLELALWYLGQNEYNKAESEYKKIINKHGDVLSANYHLGEIYDKQGRTADACKYWSKVVHLTNGSNDKGAISWRNEALKSMYKCKK